jgi:hypothetical protein
MKNRLLKLTLASLIITVGAVMGANTDPNGASTDTQIAAKVAHEMRMYSRYTIWDNVAVRVREGDVELTGQVSQPFKKADLGRLAQRVAGVRSVTNRPRFSTIVLGCKSRALSIAIPFYHATPSSPYRPSTSSWTTVM